MFVGCMSVLCVVPYVGARIENAVPIPLQDVGDNWEVEDRPELRADTVATDILRDCRPMGNGWAVLYHHAWYNLVTSGYDERIWLEESDSIHSYGLYRWSNRIFFRDQYGRDGYDNIVLVCDTSRWEW